MLSHESMARLFSFSHKQTGTVLTAEAAPFNLGLGVLDQPLSEVPVGFKMYRDPLEFFRYSGNMG